MLICVLQAIDADDKDNGKVSYHLLGGVQSTLTTELANVGGQPFVVDKKTGDITVNFDPQRGMKGYFDFVVKANDTYGLSDTARVFVSIPSPP